ncbi:MAG TPA: aromatic acid exporter family protein, partial [Thermomicrobiales bacterium]|nr:aromatic acid exporter family protein [Thermomicrobiales bacterium]
MKQTIARSLERLRRAGLGERMLKTAFAASVAYWLGLLIPHVQSPYLAPIAAILVMQLTIADSVTSALQRFAGVVVGAPLALVVAQLFGVNPLTVALVVLLSFAIGARLSLNAQGLPQVAITALLVMLVGAPHLDYALTRIAETAVGGVVGILVNALVAPPSYLPRVVARVTAFGDAIADGLEGFAGDIEGGLTPTESDARLDELRGVGARIDVATAVAQAEAGMRYNYFRRGAQAAIGRWAELSRVLDHAERQARATARSIHDAVAAPSEAPGWLRPGPAGDALAATLRANAALIRATIALTGSPDDAVAAAAWRRALADVRQRMATVVQLARPSA